MNISNDVLEAAEDVREALSGQQCKVSTGVRNSDDYSGLAVEWDYDLQKYEVCFYYPRCEDRRYSQRALIVAEVLNEVGRVKEKQAIEQK